MRRETLGTLFAILAGIISGVAIPLNKIFIVKMDTLVFTAIRSIIIGLIFLFLSLKNKPNIRTFKRNWKSLLAIALVGGAFAFLLFFSGLKLTTSGRAAFLHKTLPLYVAILAYLFLKERITKEMIYGLTFMFVGTAVIYQSQILPGPMWQNPSIGDLLVVIATILWAIENIIAKKVMIYGEDNFIVSFSRMFFGGLILFGIILLTGRLSMLLITVEQLRNIIISTAVLFAYVYTWYSSVKLINVSKATSFLLIAPVVSFLLGVIVLGEPFDSIQITGSIMILIGSYIMTKVESERLERI